MKIPKQLRIGGFVWKITQHSDVADADNSFGNIETKTQVLNLDPRNTAQKMEECLIHEILHVVFWQTGAVGRLKRIDPHLEEDLTQALAFGFYQVLKENRLLK